LEVPAIAENYTTKFRWMFEEKVFGRRPTRDARIPNPVVTLPDGSVIETYFATHDECADRLTKLIREARTSIDFLAFSFTHRAMGTAMLERSRAGVKVRGVFEKSQSTNAFTQFHALQKAGLPVFVDANPRNMHHKVMLLDRSITVTGSFNFSDSADKTNDENLVFIRNAPAVAEAFAAEIERVYGAAMTAAKN
jgi:phosphatidylserine/phosphatidylglycerophosphate/cardiolipin synthase-like enzyme